MRVIGLLLLAVTALAVPSWYARCRRCRFLLTLVVDCRKCRVCEDAMQTFHDHYRCAGEFMNWGPERDLNIKACDAPIFDCEMLAGTPMLGKVRALSVRCIMSVIVRAWRFDLISVARCRRKPLVEFSADLCLCRL